MVFLPIIANNLGRIAAAAASTLGMRLYPIADYVPGTYPEPFRRNPK